MADPSLGVAKISDKDLLEEYVDDLKKCRPIIAQALTEAKSYCIKYIETRDSLALMHAYRMEVTFGSFENKYNKTPDPRYNTLN
jgi:hypothetical protein